MPNYPHPNPWSWWMSPQCQPNSQRHQQLALHSHPYMKRRSSLRIIPVINSVYLLWFKSEAHPQAHVLNTWPPSLWHYFEGHGAFRRWGLTAGNGPIRLLLGNSYFWFRPSFFSSWTMAMWKNLPTFSNGHKDVLGAFPFTISFLSLIWSQSIPLSVSCFCRVFITSTQK